MVLEHSGFSIIFVHPIKEVTHTFISCSCSCSCLEISTQNYRLAFYNMKITIGIVTHRISGLINKLRPMRKPDIPNPDATTRKSG